MDKKPVQFLSLALVLVVVILSYFIWSFRNDMNAKIAGISSKNSEQSKTLTKLETVVKQQQIITQIYKESIAPDGSANLVKQLELKVGEKITAIENANKEIHGLITDLSAKRDVLEKQLLAADGKITTLDGKITETQKNCQEIAAKLPELTAKIEQNTKVINELMAMIEKLKQQTAENSGQIDDIKLMFSNYDVVLSIQKDKQNRNFFLCQKAVDVIHLPVNDPAALYTVVLAHFEHQRRDRRIHHIVNNIPDRRGRLAGGDRNGDRKSQSESNQPEI